MHSAGDGDDCCVMQAAHAKKYCDEQLPDFLANIEAMLKHNKNGDGFFVGDKVSLHNNSRIILIVTNHRDLVFQPN